MASIYNCMKRDKDNMKKPHGTGIFLEFKKVGHLWVASLTFDGQNSIVIGSITTVFIRNDEEQKQAFIDLMESQVSVFLKETKDMDIEFRKMGTMTA